VIEEFFRSHTVYKIGAFANLCQTSVQTLRYYERLGLIEPEYIDPFTNYRYYTLRQIEQVNRIMALKELGFTLDQIHDLISNQIATARIELMLKLKQAEIERTIEREAERLQHISFHLRLLEQENKMIEIDMTIKPAEALRILSYTGTFSSDEEARDFIGRAIATVQQADVPLTHDYFMAFNKYEYDRRLEDLEIAFPVEEDYVGEVTLEENMIFTTRDVPAVDSTLTFMHKGEFEGENGMQETVRLAYMWMAQNGYESLPPVRLSYLVIGPDIPPEEQLRQIQIPVRKIDT
jgi:DNA-binding transcriptional MerR regulator